ncbi:MAG: KH domain-containing protein, partial [Halobacteriota archaeon]
MSIVEERLDEIKGIIAAETPATISVSSVTYEGPELVVYTNDPREFASQGDLIRRLASKLRKRITIRPDPSALMPADRAREHILEVLPEDAGVTDLEFQEDIGEVLIEAEKPGLVIGRHGQTLRQITQEVGWTPEVVRTPPIESATVKNVRDFLKHERAERREILERVGRQIHRETLSDDEWVRVTTLGCCREVGRAAFILSTPETRILIDCGDKPGAEGEVPYLHVPEATPINSFDAVVLTHAHLDHSALVPLLFKYGYDGPIYTTEPTRDLMGLLTLDYLDVAAKDGRTPPYESAQVREAIKHTIPVDYGDVTDIAPDVKLTLHNAGHI